MSSLEVERPTVNSPTMKMKSVVVFKLVVMFFLISHLPKAVDCNASNENNCYTFHDVDSTWNEARDACRDMGAHLVTMETTDEWNKVKGFLAEKVAETGSYTHYYIGLRKESGTWKWTEAGSPGVTVATDDSRWQPGEPSAGPTEEPCGEIWCPSSGTQGHFNNVQCDRKDAGRGIYSTRGYICENY